jgi:site-specific DNA recombinase
MTNIPFTPHQSKGRFLAYIRVSTPKQGEGSSLMTQREAIARFATRRGLEITGWYEEKESAARRGRPIFRQVLELLSRDKADGLIVHKVDRSARNLKDWADLGELIDRGITVYFAGDGIDLTSRCGRLTADIQAVVAADYVRNLKEDAKCGIAARLEQGLLPNHAPIGYLDTGPGKVKVPDPERAPFVRMVFAWYATGEYTLFTLRQALIAVGFRNRAGGMLSISRLAEMLHNPFYMGFIRRRKAEKLYPGLHEALVDRKVFFDVQARLRSRIWPKKQRRPFRFSMRFRCAACKRCLTPEEKKGHVYYRCHGRPCAAKPSVREEVLDEVLRSSVIAPGGEFTVTYHGRELRLVDMRGSNPVLFLPPPRECGEESRPTT